VVPSSSPSPLHHASGTAASILCGVVETARSSMSDTIPADKFKEARLSPLDLDPLYTSVPFPRTFDFPRCCDLYDPGFTPASWASYNFGSCWATSKSTPFFRPRDSDSERPSTRIAVDDIMYSARGARRKIVPTVLRNRTVDDALESFDVKSRSCYWPRIVEGVPDMQMSYAIVDFGSVEEAERVFGMFQGRRVNINSKHWGLEFLDPSDRTFGGRRKLHPTSS